MTTATLTGPARGVMPRSSRRPVRAVPEATQGQTLDQLMGRIWSDLTSHSTVACPVCDGAMRPRYGAGAGAVGGRCADCGTTIG